MTRTKPLIRLFNGTGSIKTSVRLMEEEITRMAEIRVLPIQEDEIKHNLDWAHEADAIVFAGASVRKFKHGLGEQGLSNLFHAVAEMGVTYGGVCAGAAFAASHIVYDVFEEGAHKRLENTGLGFFPGFARGPIKTLTTAPHDNTLQDIHLIDVARLADGEDHKAAYWSGPELIPERNGAARNYAITSVLKGRSVPLSMTGRFENGHIALYSFHPEITADNYHRWIMVDNPSLTEKQKLNALKTHLIHNPIRHFIRDLGFSAFLK